MRSAAGSCGLLQSHMRKRSLAPDRVEAVHEFVGRRRLLAERDHVFFDLPVRVAIELGGMVMVGANGVVDRLRRSRESCRSVPNASEQMPASRAMAAASRRRRFMSFSIYTSRA